MTQGCTKDKYVWEHSRAIFGERYESDKAKDKKAYNPNGSQVSMGGTEMQMCLARVH